MNNAVGRARSVPARIRGIGVPDRVKSVSAPGRVKQLTAAVRERPGVAIACAAGALLLIVWIAWAIHVGSTNGGAAAVGVLISWPLVFTLAATLALLVIATTRLIRWMQPDGPSASPAADGAKEAADGEKETEGEDDSDDEKEPERKDDEPAPEAEAATETGSSK